MPRKKVGSITEQRVILFKPMEQDKKVLASLETTFMNEFGLTDCSKVAGAELIRWVCHTLEKKLRHGRV